MHNLSDQSKFQMLYPLKNSQYSMNTIGPYGPSGGERVNRVSVNAVLNQLCLSQVKLQPIKCIRFVGLSNQIVKSNAFDKLVYRVSQKIVPCLCGYCGGAVHFIVPVLTQLDGSGFNLVFDTLYESI